MVIKFIAIGPIHVFSNVEMSCIQLKKNETNN